MQKKKLFKIFTALLSLALFSFLGCQVGANLDNNDGLTLADEESAKLYIEADNNRAYKSILDNIIKEEGKLEVEVICGEAAEEIIFKGSAQDIDKLLELAAAKEELFASRGILKKKKYHLRAKVNAFSCPAHNIMCNRMPVGEIDYWYFEEFKARTKFGAWVRCTAKNRKIGKAYGYSKGYSIKGSSPNGWFRDKERRQRVAAPMATYPACSSSSMDI